MSIGDQMILQSNIARMFAALSATNEAILYARSPEQLFQQVCDAAQRLRGSGARGRSSRVGHHQPDQCKKIESADGEIRTPGQRFTKPLLYH